MSFEGVLMEIVLKNKFGRNTRLADNAITLN